MDFDSVEDLYNYCEKSMKSVVLNEVAETEKQVEKEVIQEVVLSSYDTKEYKRRTSGGIEDVKNMSTHTIDLNNGVDLIITNDTELNPADNFWVRNYRLDEAIEHGGQKYYEYPLDKKKRKDKEKYSYLNPRPFTKETENRLRTTKEHEKAYKEGMKAKGIDLG